MNSASTEQRSGTPPVRVELAPALRWARANTGLMQTVLAVGLYTAYAAYLTWPAVAHLSSVFYGAPGDAYGTMSFYRELSAHAIDPFVHGAIPQFAAPEGQAIPWARDLAAAPSIILQLALTSAFGQIAAFDLYSLLGYVVTGVATFLLIRRLTSNVWAALIGGWAFAFYPFAVLNGQGHTDYIHGWVFVLSVWRLLELLERPTPRNGVLAGAAVAFSMWWTPYFILIGGVTYAAVLAASLIIAGRRGELRASLPAQAIAATIVVVFLGFLAALSLGPTGESVGVRTNDLAEFNAYAARPLEYLLPDGRSLLLGGTTGPYLRQHIHGSNPTEATLYVGVTMILLAIAAGVGLLRRRLPGDRARAAIVMAVIAAVAVVTSAPPHGEALGINVPFPSDLIMKVTTTWRVYSRFVIVVMLALAVLGGIGLDVLTRRRRAATRAMISLTVAAVVILDLGSRITVLEARTNGYLAPQVFHVLARQPHIGLAAEYPLVPNGENSYNDLFYQDVDGFPRINGYLTGSMQEHRALSLANLAAPSTASRLAALGVHYVILETTPPGYGQPPPGTPKGGFRRLFGDAFASLYEVTAAPAGPALPAADAGFSDDAALPDGGTYNWLERPRASIDLAGRCRGCTGVFSMTLSSFAQPRRVTIMYSGHVIERLRVAGPRRVSFRLTYEPGHPLTVATSPGPQSIQATVGGADTRSVSIQVGDLRYVFPARR